MKDNWIDKMRHKLEGHEMSPPTGLWESISEEMGFEQEDTRKPFAIKRWLLAAAASVLVVVGFFTYNNINDLSNVSKEENLTNYSDGETIIEKESNLGQGMANNVASSLDGDKEPLKTATAETMSHHTVKEALAYVKNNKADKDLIAKQDTSVQKEVTGVDTRNMATADNHDTAPKNKDEEKVENDMPKVDEQQTKTINNQYGEKDRHLANLPSHTVTKSSRMRAKRWTVGMNASGGLLAAQKTERNERIYYNYASLTSFSNDFSGFIVNNGNNGYKSYGYADYEAKHSIPMRFGANVQYKLNERLSLLSGINYTYLHSEFSLPLYDISVENQNLHYLGIPVGLVCKLWSVDHMRLYLSGGGMVEKCLNAKPWQYSVNVAAGAEYAITPLVGCYIEPSLGYYFDDGTSYEHYYKEHPMAPAIEVGIRLHINE